MPIILANSATPLLGLADTAVVGNAADAVNLGAVALGSLVFNFLYWGFGFLRMGTTGFVAQASSRGDTDALVATLARALALGLAIGLLLVLLQAPIAAGARALLGATPAVEAETARYVAVRIWAAPATLMLYVLMGWFIGTGETGKLLVVQVAMNGLNIALDVLFAGVLGWGAEGVALGTALSEASAVVLALWLTLRALPAGRRSPRRWPWRQALARADVLKMLRVNGDIMIRTLFLLAGFALFADRGARFGDVVLDGNHVLLQFVSFSAFFLDGFAFAMEGLVGRAIGAGDRVGFDRVVRRATVLAAVTAVGLAVGLWLLGSLAIDLLTDLAAVRAVAKAYLPLAGLYVLLSFPAFQLDGVFIGATASRAMRNASILSFGAFLLALWLLADDHGNAGLWWAFIVFVVARAVFLGAFFPSLRRDVAR
ncbi:MAG: MATE family efflux transporter [Myxococcales bacterium]|nr:MATE family efflux transporter [Myxococcales bacterium]